MLLQGSYFTVKDVDENDINEILDVYRECEDFLSLGPVAKASVQMIRDDFKISNEEGGIFCGIFIGCNMVGVFDFVLNNFDGNPGHAYLSLLMISKPYRRQGLGRAAVELVEAEICKSSSIKAILAGVQTNNKSAIAFWAGMGYRIIGGPDRMPDTTVVYRLMKDIT